MLTGTESAQSAAVSGTETRQAVREARRLPAVKPPGPTPLFPPVHPFFLSTSPKTFLKSHPL